MKYTYIVILISSIFFIGCENMFNYSPYVINFNEEDKNVNQTNIDFLLKKNADDTVRIAFTGDTHRYFDEFDGFVNSVNEINRNNPIDFVVHVGDIADFGLPQQYLWGNSYLLNLACPYFAVVGNHDLVGNGKLGYSEMFGDFNFSFIYSDIKFIFIDTNSREYGFDGKVPDINWLESQLTPNKNFKKAVVIFHIPPMNGDFDSSLEEDFHTSLEKFNNVMFTVHGHLHNHEIYYPYSDDITYVNVYGIEYEKFNIITITNEKFEIETCKF